MPVTRTPYAPPPDTPPVVHHADNHLIIVEKPNGLLSVPGRGPDKADCLEARVRRTHADALTVHRLDMETSGLVLFARGPDAQRELSKLFEARSVGKSYVACVHGRPVDDEGVIDLPLSADWPNRPMQKADARGKPARTRWEVVERGTDRTRLKLFPSTGRTHQLRVHLFTIGHPILGDTLYGGVESRSASNRLLLHASRLCFIHPATGLQIDVASPVPF
ncbi:MAG: RluA family pseudouridine synthase [Pseudomonadota bacterium]